MTLLAAVGIILPLTALLVGIKSYHKNHQSYLKPISANLDIGSDQWTVKIKNYGPGLAMNVRVKGAVVKTFFDRKAEYRAGQGPNEISISEEAGYIFPYKLIFQVPFLLEWKSSTGLSQCARWYIIIPNTVNTPDIVQPVTAYQYYLDQLRSYFQIFIETFSKFMGRKVNKR